MGHKYSWEPIEEMDLEDGTHTGYAAKDNSGNYVWITQIADDTWDVEIKKGDAFVTVANCKTLTSAKRWVARYW